MNLLVMCIGGCGTQLDLASSDEALSFTDCLEITTSGSYTLDADIANAPTSCVHIHDASNVSLDCGHHQIQAIGYAALDIDRVTNLTLANCTVTRTASVTAWGVELDDVHGANIDDNDLDGVDVRTSSGLAVTNNHVRVYWQQFSTTGTVAQANTFDNPAFANSPALFISLGGSGNQLLGNHMDGFWTGNPQDYGVRGTDDSVVLGDEQADVVDSNTIANSWDCGIETVGTITDSRFTNNTISNSQTCAIGAWYYSSWLRNVVQGNHASATGWLFEFFSADLGLRANDTAISFRDNTFTGNVGRSAYLKFDQTRTGAPYGPDVRNINQGDYRVGNNVFTGNDLEGGIVLASPWFVAVDGGGNTCATTNDPTQALACSRPAPVPQVFDDVLPSDPDFFLINDMAAQGLTHGCTPTRFCVSDLVTRDQVAVFIIRALFGDSFSYTPTAYFTDVPAGDPFFPYVQKMRDLGLTSGCEPKRYCRSYPVTRGELSVFLVRANQIRGVTSPEVPDTAYFGDVPPSHPFYPFVQIIRELAVMPGCSVDSFCPDQDATRRVVASALMRMLRTN